MSFQVPYRIWSGPEVEEFEHLASALETSPGVISGVSENN
jgi:hypothetical protein